MLTSVSLPSASPNGSVPQGDPGRPEAALRAGFAPNLQTCGMLRTAAPRRPLPQQSLHGAVILEPKKIKSVTISTVSTSISHEVMGLDAMILVKDLLNGF